MNYKYFEIEVVESTGNIGKAGSPFLICRAESAFSQDSANVFLLVYNTSQRKWIEYYKTIDSYEADLVIERLKRLGFPTRLPEVEGVHQTATFWINFSLKIKLDDQRFYLDLSATEGMKGKDAANLYELFEYLFSLAGYQP